VIDTGEGFPKSCRLSKPSQFRTVFSSDKRSTDSQFLVIAAENGLDTARLGLAISKRSIRTAVSRNRIKRLVRESFRRNRAKLVGLDVVVVAQKRIAATDSKRILHSLNQHWEKIST
jgi:ribonuclease P protein component